MQNSLETPDSTHSTVAPRAADGSGPTESRPSRLTPDSGLLGALLAEKLADAADAANAKKLDRSQTAAVDTHQDSVTPVGTFDDPLETTEVGGSTSDKRGELERAKASGVVRSTRMTPGSGRLAALLAQTRAESAKTVVPDAGAAVIVTPERTAGSGAVMDEPEVTEVDLATRGKTADSKADDGETRVANGPRPTRITPVGGGLTALLANTRNRIGKQDSPDSHDSPDRKTPIFAADVLNIFDARVVALDSEEATVPDLDASSPQKKNPGFAATLPGVLAPIVDPSGRVDLSTEKNAPAAADTSEAATFGERVSSRVSPEDRPFRVDVTDAVKPNRRSRVLIGLSVGVVVVVAAILMAPRNRTGPERSQQTAVSPRPDEVVAGRARVDPPPPPAPIMPTADPLMGANPKSAQPVAVPVVATEPQAASPAAASPTALPTAPPAPTEEPAEKPAEKLEAKVQPKTEDGVEAKAEAKSEAKGAARPDPGTAGLEVGPSSEPARREASRSQSHPSEARKTAAKNKRKTQLIRAAAEEFVRGPSVGQQARPRISAPGVARPAGEDPDAVLPLSRH